MARVARVGTTAVVAAEEDVAVTVNELAKQKDSAAPNSSALPFAGSQEFGDRASRNKPTTVAAPSPAANEGKRLTGVCEAGRVG